VLGYLMCFCVCFLMVVLVRLSVSVQMISALAVFSRNALYKSTFYFLFLLTK